MASTPQCGVNVFATGPGGERLYDGVVKNGNVLAGHRNRIFRVRKAPAAGDAASQWGGDLWRLVVRGWLNAKLSPGFGVGSAGLELAAGERPLLRIPDLDIRVKACDNDGAIDSGVLSQKLG